MFIIFWFLFSFTVRATEVDNTTTYYDTIADSEVLLNQVVQEKLDIALGHTRGCQRRNLLRHAGAQLVGNIVYETIEAFANASDDVDRVYTAVPASMYHHTSYQGGIVDTFVNLGPTVNVAGQHLGTDKIGHFFAMGYTLYGSESWGQNITQLIGHSVREETGLWGLYTTGVRSYGDTVANFDGLRFFRDLVNEGPTGYYKCEDDRLVQVRAFRFSDYVTAAWNEAINCNAYWSPEFGQQVAANGLKLENKFGRRYACPIDPSQCAGLRAHYGQFVPPDLVSALISPDCR